MELRILAKDGQTLSHISDRNLGRVPLPTLTTSVHLRSLHELGDAKDE